MFSEESTRCTLAGTKYQDYGNCNGHCLDIALGENYCDYDNGVPGCVCTNDMVFNEGFSMCVPIDQCNCVDMFDHTITYPPGSFKDTTCQNW